jgi:arylsulfatase A-like enzyme
MREPTIFWGPGHIQQGFVQDLGSTMDLFTTFSAMAGVTLPEDRIIDGVDLTGILLDGKTSPRKSILYYRGTELYAVRLGDYKAHFITQGAYGQFEERQEHTMPLLYNVAFDAGENYNIAEKHPAIIQKIRNLVLEHESKLVKGKDQLVERE